MGRRLATSLMVSSFYFFQEYIIHVDPVSQLGLNSDSVLGYSIGEVKRSNTSETPELLPCGYLVGENTTISVTVKGNAQAAEEGAFRGCGYSATWLSTCGHGFVCAHGCGWWFPSPLRPLSAVILTSSS